MYRIVNPLEHLGRLAAWQTAWTPLDEVARLTDLYGYDIYVLPRLYADVKQIQGLANHPGFRAMLARGDIKRRSPYPIIEVLQARGKKVVYEVDDDFTNVHREVPGGGQNSMPVAQSCDAITVTTPYLQALMEEWTGRPVYVCPNCVDFEMWATPGFERPEILRDRIVIGLTGSTTHYHDWIVLQDVMPRVLADYPNVVLLLGRFHPDYFEGLPEEQCIKQPGAKYAFYPNIVRSCDLILCPVDPDDKFNDSKSAIKATEGMAAGRDVNGSTGGACVIATHNLVYSADIQHEKTGLLVEHTPADWENAIRRMIEDERLRQRLQIRGHMWARSKRNIATQTGHWARAYTQILKQPPLV